MLDFYNSLSIRELCVQAWPVWHIYKAHIHWMWSLLWGEAAESTVVFPVGSYNENLGKSWGKLYEKEAFVCILKGETIGAADTERM